MGWVALDDGFFANPKVLKVGHAGAGLYAMGLSYCGKYLTEGFIPSEFLASQPRKLVEKLAEVGLWITVPGGVQIEDYLEYNPTRAEVEKRKAQAKKAAGARWDKGAGSNTKSNAESNASGNAGSNADAYADAMPSHPLPSHTPSTRGGFVSKGRGEGLPESHEKDLARLVELVTDSDDDTPGIFALYAAQLPLGSVAKVRESVELHHEPVGAGYVVRALQSEIRERAEAA